MNYGDRLAPVALTVERPVLHLVLYTLLAKTLFLQVSDDLFDRVLLIGKAVEKIGVYHLTVTGVCLFLNVAALDDRDDVDAEFLCKLVVTLIVCGHSHDCACAVAHHNVVGDVYGHLLACEGIYAGYAVNTDTCLVLDKLCALKFTLLGTFCLVRIKLPNIPDAVTVFVYDRMLGCDYHECDTEQSIGAGGVYPQSLVEFLYSEIHECACGLAYPVLLLEPDIGKIIHLIKACKELVCVFRYAQIPDFLLLLYDVAVADITLAPL